MVALTSELLAAVVIPQLVPGSHTLVYLPYRNLCFAASLGRQAATKAASVSFSCLADDADTLYPSWLSLSVHTSRQVLKRKLHAVKATHFLDMTSYPSAGSREITDLALNIMRALPPGCVILDSPDISRPQAVFSPSVDLVRLTSLLKDAVIGAMATLSAADGLWNEQILRNIVELHQYCNSSTPHQSATVLRWPNDGDVNLEIPAIDGKNLFSHNKTYLLFGLSGQVGQSLCEWMVSNGAGCVCLLSRHPNVDQRWLESFQSTQATVRTFEVDITDMGNLDLVLREIKRDLPPVSGVVNGANVASDAPFDIMSTDMMLRALRPKISGSFNLDQAFYDANLDFFVLFSSISCVLGTSGQSNYVAANGYMNGLVRQRRRRGLAASAIDLGLILGIGLAEAAGQSVVNSLRKYAVIPLSETDVRLAFAEAIRAGYADPKEKEEGAMPPAVITSGLRTIHYEETEIVWHDNPVFSHLVIHGQDGDDTGIRSGNSQSAVPVKDQLKAAATREEVLQILTGKAFGLSY